jgi:hypothetical protein
MNDPNGTFIKRLLSTSQTEQLDSWARAAFVVLSATTPAAASAPARVMCPSSFLTSYPLFSICAKMFSGFSVTGAGHRKL